MTCPNPANAGQLTSGDPEGASSCVAYSFSYGVCEATQGAHHPTGNNIRDWTGDHSGGLNLIQCDVAVYEHTGVDFDTKVVTRDGFNRLLDAGYGMVLLGGYGPLSTSKFSGQPTFKGNHAIWVPSLAAMDPLCDGRRAGIYRYHGEAYPRTLIYAYAAALRLSNGALAGGDHFEVSAIKLPTPLPPTSTAYQVKFDGGTIGYYKVSGAHITGVTTMTGRNPFTLRCSAPRTYLWPGHKPRRLVRILEGFAKGRYVNVGNPKIHLQEV